MKFKMFKSTRLLEKFVEITSVFERIICLSKPRGNFRILYVFKLNICREWIWLLHNGRISGTFS